MTARAGRTALTLVPILLAIAFGTWLALPSAKANPTAPTITPMGPGPFFMMGNATAGVAQQTSSWFKASDGSTAWNDFTISASLVSANNMGGNPGVAVNTLPDTNDNKIVYFELVVTCDSGIVTGATSNAVVRITVTSNATQESATHDVTLNTFKDTDRP